MVRQKEETKLTDRISMKNVDSNLNGFIGKIGEEMPHYLQALSLIMGECNISILLTEKSVLLSFNPYKAFFILQN